MKSKRGNSIVIVIGIFIVLMVMMVSFFQSGVKSTHTANLVGERLLAQKFASSVALVTCQYIKSILPQRNGENPLSMELHDALSVPLNMMKTESKIPSSGESLFEIINDKLKVDSEGILDYLIKEYTETEDNKLGLRGLEIKDLHIELRKSEFQPKSLTSKGEHFFPREKEGYLHICFDVRYVIPGVKASERAKENYRFYAWYLNNYQWKFGFDVVTEDINLVARWVRTYTVIFDSDGADERFSEDCYILSLIELIEKS